MTSTTLEPGFRDSWRRAALVSLAVVVLGGIIVALVGGGGRGGGVDAAGHSSADEASGEMAAPATTVAGATGQGDDAGVADEDGGGADGVSVASAAPTAIGPRIVMTGALQVRVKGDVARAVERARAIATGAGGFVASSSTSTFQEGRGSGEITLRVPADTFDDVRRRVEELGTVQSSESSGQDVGGQLVDLAARLRTLRAEEVALETILGNASEIGQILQVRDRLTGVRTQIEQLAGQQASLEDRVAYATLQVSLHEAGAPEPVPPRGGDDDGLAASVRTAIDAAEAVVGGMVVVLGAALPFVLLAAVVGAVVQLARRRTAAS